MRTKYDSVSGPQLKLVVTADGSHTLFHTGIGEHYHSMGGAISESMHVYVQNGLVPVMENNDIFHLYETGLGTGLNALLTCNEARKRCKNIHYHACELMPLESNLIKQLNYPFLLNSEFAEADFSAIHSQAYNGKPVRIHKHFILSKHQCDFSEVTFHDEQLRLVFFDAFSSNSQPELWCIDLFTKLWKAMLPGAFLVTYATAGHAKQALRHSGFQVQRLQGAVGKREMLRAVKL